jgi:hypothetical protein
MNWLMLPAFTRSTFVICLFIVDSQDIYNATRGNWARIFFGAAIGSKSEKQ